MGLNLLFDNNNFIKTLQDFYKDLSAFFFHRTPLWTISIHFETRHCCNYKSFIYFKLGFECCLRRSKSFCWKLCFYHRILFFPFLNVFIHSLSRGNIEMLITVNSEEMSRENWRRGHVEIVKRTTQSGQTRALQFWDSLGAFGSFGWGSSSIA